MRILINVNKGDRWWMMCRLTTGCQMASSLLIPEMTGHGWTFANWYECPRVSVEKRKLLALFFHESCYSWCWFIAGWAGLFMAGDWLMVKDLWCDVVAPRIAKAQEGDIFTAKDVGDGLMMWERRLGDCWDDLEGWKPWDFLGSIVVNYGGSLKTCSIGIILGYRGYIEIITNNSG